MDLGQVILWLLLLFFVIYCSVRLAIRPLIYKKNEINDTEPGLKLEKLRDIGVLNVEELDEVIEIYSKKISEEKLDRQFDKYSKILEELRKVNYFSDDEYIIKLEKLKSYFNIK
jgi:hypothetical protein